MAGAGAEVTLAARGSDAKAAAAAATMIMESTENKQIFVAPLDLAEPASVTGFVEAWRGPLDILVNNAGIMAVPEQYTPQGWELHFATNHLGHFALANGLGRVDGWVHLGNIAAQARGPKPRSNSRAPWSASRNSEL